MSANGGQHTTLPDEVTTLISLGPDDPETAVASLRTLLDKLTTTSRTESLEEGLQLLGTAVGKQSMRENLMHEPS